MDAATDSELAAAFACKTPGAFEEAYRRHLALLVAVARSVAGENEDVHDSIHDTLLRLWLAPQAYRVERGALRAFLVVCVRNGVLARRRAAARHREIEGRLAAAGEFDPPAELRNSDDITHARLHAALGTLPAEQRSVIELAYYGSCTHTQIAHRLGIPLGTVKSRASLGLRKLARFFEADREP